MLAQYERLMAVFAAALVGLAWVVVCIHMGRVLQWTALEQASALAAVLLGAFSTAALLWVSAAANALVGVDSSQLGRAGLIFNLLYCILGIGLPEEAVKLLFFLPLVPVIRRIQHERALKTLTLASMVGLGFALEENIGYFAGGDAGAPFGRFLTANFAHMSLTGLAGYALVQLFEKGSRRTEDFLETFALVVVLHGVYDFLLAEPSLAGVKWLAVTVYIFLAQRYLGTLMAVRPRGYQRVSLTHVFTAALGLSLGAGYLLSAERLGFVGGFLAILPGAFGIAIIAIMFYREFDETIQRFRR